MVHFENRRIRQIRLYWDQGSLLKRVDVIGARAKNWPIKDGEEQIRLIASSHAAVSTDSNMETTTKQMGEVTITSMSPRKKVGSDPHASLSLFEVQASPEHDPSFAASAVAPRTSARPAQRDYHDLFVGSESDKSPASQLMTPSPQKADPSNGLAKTGGGKNFQPSRLFENQANKQEETYIKTDPTKYNHFDFADGSEDPRPEPAKPRPKSKHDSQWGFEDFTTPAKAAAKPHSQDVRHFSWSDDELVNSPIKNPPAMPKPRRDAETHIEFQDDGIPEPGRRAGHPRGMGSANTAAGLYHNNVYDEEGSTSPEKPARSYDTAPNIKDRAKDFAPHFDMTDSPGGRGESTGQTAQRPNIANRNKTFGSQWDVVDEAAEARENPGTIPSHGHAKERKAFESHWDVGDDTSGLGEKSASERNRPAGGMHSRAVSMMEAQWENGDQSLAGKGRGKENLGLAAKKATGPNWGVDDEDPNASEPFVAGKKISKGGQENRLWDF